MRGGGGGLGGGRRLALAHLLEVRLRGFTRAEDEVELHLIQLGVVWVSLPKNPALADVDIGDGAHLYPAPVRDVGGGSHKGMRRFRPPFLLVRRPRFFATPLRLLLPPLLFWGGTAFYFGGGGSYSGIRLGVSLSEDDQEEEAGSSDSWSKSKSDSNRLRFFAWGALPPLPFLGGGGGGG